MEMDMETDIDSPLFTPDSSTSKYEPPLRFSALSKWVMFVLVECLCLIRVTLGLKKSLCRDPSRFGKRRRLFNCDNSEWLHSDDTTNLARSSLLNFLCYIQSVRRGLNLLTIWSLVMPRRRGHRRLKILIDRPKTIPRWIPWPSDANVDSELKKSLMTFQTCAALWWRKRAGKVWRNLRLGDRKPRQRITIASHPGKQRK